MLVSTIREIVAPVLRECPRECGIVSIVRVDISPDCSYATMYISSLSKPDVALEYLRTRTPDLQRRLSDLPRKKIPLLRFRQDKELERGVRLDELLEKAAKQLPQDTSDEPQE